MADEQKTCERANEIRLPLAAQPSSRDEYKTLWGKCGPLEIQMVGKTGRCNHDVGDSFRYEHPYARPTGACPALLHVLDLYTWRVALGFPSWEADDPTVYRIHCPSKNGSVWELRKLSAPD